MRHFIDPIGMTKEQWLDVHAKVLSHAPSWEKDFMPKESLPVCLVDNGAFTAAAIAYSERELEYFTNDPGGRPQRWYLASTENLIKVQPQLEGVLNHGN